MIEKSGATVLIDPVSLNYMAGSEIDFVDDLIGSVLQGQQSEGHRLLRLRHELRALRRSSRQNRASARAHRHLERQFDQAAP